MISCSPYPQGPQACEDQKGKGLWIQSYTLHDSELQADTVAEGRGITSNFGSSGDVFFTDVNFHL